MTESVATISDQRATAVHEAGHAVVSILERRRFRHVSVVEDDHTLGRVLGVPVGDWFRPDLEVDARARRWIEQEIAILLAGGIAEARYRGLNDAAELAGVEHDFGIVVDLADYGSSAEVDAYVAWLVERTKNMLSNELRWSRIELLADELLAAGTLSYQDARRIVLPALAGSRASDKC